MSGALTVRNIAVALLLAALALLPVYVALGGNVFSSRCLPASSSSGSPP